MPFPNHNPFVFKIFPVTPFNSKISTLVPAIPLIPKDQGGGGVETNYWWRLIIGGD